MKGKGTISWCDTQVTPSDTCDTAFLVDFLKNAVFALSVEWAILTKFTEPNCSTETAVSSSLMEVMKPGCPGNVESGKTSFP